MLRYLPTLIQVRWNGTCQPLAHDFNTNKHLPQNEAISGISTECDNDVLVVGKANACNQLSSRFGSLTGSMHIDSAVCDESSNSGQ